MCAILLLLYHCMHVVGLPKQFTLTVDSNKTLCIIPDALYFMPDSGIIM